jgi:hypothetical protein
MYVLYETATGKVVRASISSVKAPAKEDVIGDLDPALHDGFTTADDPDLPFNTEKYLVKQDASGNPYLEYQPQVKLEYSGDYMTVWGWRRIIQVDRPSPMTIHIRDENGNPLFLTGEVRIDSRNLFISNSHEILDGTKSDINLTLIGRHPGHTSVEIHMFPDGRPFHRAKFRIDVVSIGTCRKLASLPYYELTTDALDSDGDGLPDIPADGVSSATLTIRKKNADGTDNTTDTDEVRLTTDRGKLSAETVSLAGGTASVTLTSVPETVIATIRVKPATGNVVWDELALHVKA